MAHNSEVVWCAWVVAACTLSAPQRAHGVIFFDTDSPTYHTSAPTGPYEDSGWQYQGFYGGFLGTMVSPHHFITAQHIGATPTQFVYKDVFSGSGADEIFTVDVTANSGQGYWDVPDSDLRIFQIDETFPTFAELFTGNEVGKEVVTIGRGGPRGDAVVVGSAQKGWKTGASDGTPRWGRNQIVSVDEHPTAGKQLVADFDELSGQDEAHLSVGDSGGGLFIKDTDGVWKLAGINFAVDGPFDTNAVAGDTTEFFAALYDIGGLYTSDDNDVWAFEVDSITNRPSQFYASQISAHVTDIQSIIVPEPHSSMLVLTAAMGLFSSRRRFRR